MIHARKTGKRIVLAAERDAKALQLRIEGYSLEQIKDALDYGSISEVSTIISKRLRERLTPPTEELRELERSRADHTEALAHRYMRKFDEEGRLSAADAAALIRIASTSQERRAKLLGLDAPTKIEQSGSITAYGSAGMIQAIQLIVQSGGELPPAAREFLATAEGVNQIPNELKDVLQLASNSRVSREKLDATEHDRTEQNTPKPPASGLALSPGKNDDEPTTTTTDETTESHKNAAPASPPHRKPRTETRQDSTDSGKVDL